MKEPVGLLFLRKIYIFRQHFRDYFKDHNRWANITAKWSSRNGDILQSSIRQPYSTFTEVLPNHYRNMLYHTLIQSYKIWISALNEPCSNCYWYPFYFVCVCNCWNLSTKIVWGSFSFICTTETYIQEH